MPRKALYPFGEVFEVTDPEIVWRNPPADLALSDEDVHLWRAELDLSPSRVANLREILSEDEKERADRFHFEKDRNRFTVARSHLRLILGRYLKREPGELVFQYSPKDKPALAGAFASDDIRFNLSHSGGFALYAVTRGREVGIDIEDLEREVDYEGIADRYFTPRECKLISEAGGQKKEVFLSLWTLKEAYIKAKGEGLSIPLNRFEVISASLNIAGDPVEANRWSLRKLVPAPDYVAAVAVEGHGWNLATFSISDR